MGTLRFAATIEIHTVNPFVLVSAARAARLKKGWRKPMPVVVRIDGQPPEGWRINMMPVGDGSFRLYLHGTLRHASGTGVGDRVNVEVGFDAEYQGGSATPARLVSRGAGAIAGRRQELGGAPAEPAEGDRPLLLGSQIRRGPRTPPRPRHAGAVGRARPLHGQSLEGREIASFRRWRRL